MRIFNENDLLDKGFRADIIKEIEGQENASRRQEMFARWEIFRDKIKKYVHGHLVKEMDPETVEEMKSRISNINLYKKVVTKKSRVYQTAPNRKLEVDGNDEIFKELLDFINLDTTMKKANNYLEAFRNSLVYVRPYKCFDEIREDGEHLWKYQLSVIPPHMYDVIEDSENPEKGRVYILSPHEQNNLYNEQQHAYHSERGRNQRDFSQGDNKSQIIADSPADADEPERRFIVWSKNYHFTMNEKGEVIDGPEDMLNPIQELPFVDIARGRDGSYWALGGDDLVDGTILVNALLTDLYFIQKIQGMGLFYFFGKNAPKAFKLGPNRGITHEVEDGDPTPQIGFASSNPPIQSHMSSIEQYVAFLLTTNDLGTNAVSSKLDGRNPSSGIQELVVNSEPMNAIEDDQELFKDVEPRIVEIATLWHNYYFDRNLLSQELAEMGKLPEFNYSLVYSKPEQLKTEKETLESIKQRMDLGLLDKVGAIIEQNPDLSEDEAIEYVRKMEERKMSAMSDQIKNMVSQSEEDDGRSEDQDQTPGEA